MASHLLAALGTEDIENDEAHARAYVGAVVMAEAIHDIRLIRQMLQAALTKK